MGQWLGRLALELALSSEDTEVAGSNPVSGLICHTFFKVLFVESNLELNISKVHSRFSDI